MIHAILTDLGHDVEDRQVRQVVRLRLIEGGNSDRQLPPSGA